VLLLLLALLLPALSQAAIETKSVEYRQGDTRLVGYLAYPKDAKGPLPGILVVHEWMGLNDYAKRRAEQLAELGYVALAADIYGDGKIAANREEAGKLAGSYKQDRPLLRARVAAGLATLKAQSGVAPSKVAAIGYCFGGTTVLELARSGADLAGVVSFHGGLDTPTPQDAKNIRAKVLALHGADDPYVPADQVAAFENEMRQAGGGLAVGRLRRRGAQLHQSGQWPTTARAPLITPRLMPAPGWRCSSSSRNCSPSPTERRCCTAASS
jgi:dienelactone hydrolase